MNCTAKRKSKFLRIKRDFSYSRLGAECLASAYEIILPVFRHEIPTAKTTKLEQTWSISTEQAVRKMGA